VRIRNTGAAPLKLKGLFFRFESGIRGLPAPTPPNLWGAPTADCWMDEASGRFFGAVASKDSGMRIAFWVDKADGSAHPDARWEMPETVVAPGATFTPQAPLFLIGLAGRGGNAEWTRGIGPVGALLRGRP
jgi:hypothetical protein